MHIAVLMFSRKSGGIEQAFIDQCRMLSQLGYRVSAITQPHADINAALAELGIPMYTLANVNEWDLLATLRLRRLFRAIRPDVIISHANRAIVLADRARQADTPLIGMVHKYSFNRFSRVDAAFAPTQSLIDAVTQAGGEKVKAFHIPNMVACNAVQQRASYRSPPVIGSLGRFVSKKGFITYVDALAILRKRGLEFRAVLGGEGVEQLSIKARIAYHGLGDIMEMTGWVSDRDAFYSGIDIFCLPSLHEPFGIVLLEAFSRGIPVVSTLSEGPSEIAAHREHALMVKIGCAESLADALAELLADPAAAHQMAARAYAHTVEKYSIDAVGSLTRQALQQIAV